MLQGLQINKNMLQGETPLLRDNLIKRWHWTDASLFPSPSPHFPASCHKLHARTYQTKEANN